MFMYILNIYIELNTWDCFTYIFSINDVTINEFMIEVAFVSIISSCHFLIN